MWQWQNKAHVFLYVTLSRGKTCPRKVGFTGKTMGRVLRQEWVLMWLSWELLSQSEQWRIPRENCEARWAQSASAWDPLPGSKVLELKALWILRCCVVLIWPQILWGDEVLPNRRRFVLIHCYYIECVGKRKHNAEYCLMNHFSLILRKGLWEGRTPACWSPCVGVDVCSSFLVYWFCHSGSLLLFKWDLQEDVMRKRV